MVFGAYILTLALPQRTMTIPLTRLSVDRAKRSTRCTGVNSRVAVQYHSFNRVRIIVLQVDMTLFPLLEAPGAGRLEERGSS